jgi:hypothetical protein
MVEVIDAGGVPRDMDWVKQKYGVEIDTTIGGDTPPTHIWACYRLLEKIGPTSMTVTARRDTGEKLGIRVAFHWPEAPYPPTGGDLGVLPGDLAEYVNDPHNNFVFGDTGIDGAVGFGMGGGGAHGEGEGGPHEVWIHDTTTPTHVVTKLGWLAGTNHAHLEPWFEKRLVQVEPSEPPEPPEPPEGEVPLLFLLSHVAALLRTCADLLDKVVQAYGG